MTRPSHRPPIVAARVREIANDSFVFLPHRFLRDGFFAALSAAQLRLYVFLLLAADRSGVSYYHYDSICSLLECTLDDYIAARNALIDKDLIAFDGTRFQVLSLPPRPRFDRSAPLTSTRDMHDNDPATIRRHIRHALNQKLDP
jgi:hypothetical protein